MPYGVVGELYVGGIGVAAGYRDLPEKAAILSAMTAYMNTAHGKKEISLPCSSHYTTQVLARMGFFWNQSNERYIDDFINALRGFMFFSRDNLKR